MEPSAGGLNRQVSRNISHVISRSSAAETLRHSTIRPRLQLRPAAKKPLLCRPSSALPFPRQHRIENGEKRGPNKPLRQNTRSADASIRSRSRGSRLSRVLRSTGTPRLRSRSCLMPTNSTREKWLSRSYSMKRSRSLWAAASSRARSRRAPLPRRLAVPKPRLHPAFS
jgi:hypothetical protein